MIDAASIAEMIHATFPWTATIEIQPMTRLKEDIELDSLHLVELQAAIEEVLDVEFDPLDDDFIDAFDDVASLATYATRLSTVEA